MRTKNLFITKIAVVSLLLGVFSPTVHVDEVKAPKSMATLNEPQVLFSKLSNYDFDFSLFMQAEARKKKKYKKRRKAIRRARRRANYRHHRYHHHHDRRGNVLGAAIVGAVIGAAINEASQD